MGAVVLAANDEFFAPKEALIKASAPEWREGVYTERGKWMDGWETRRRRTPGYDWAIVRLGLPGMVREAVIDTSYFTGNYPQRSALASRRAAIFGIPSLGCADESTRRRGGRFSCRRSCTGTLRIGLRLKNARVW